MKRNPFIALGKMNIKISEEVYILTHSCFYSYFSLQNQNIVQIYFTDVHRLTYNEPSWPSLYLLKLHTAHHTVLRTVIHLEQHLVIQNRWGKIKKDVIFASHSRLVPYRKNGLTEGSSVHSFITHKNYLEES